MTAVRNVRAHLTISWPYQLTRDDRLLAKSRCESLSVFHFAGDHANVMPLRSRQASNRSEDASGVSRETAKI